MWQRPLGLLEGQSSSLAFGWRRAAQKRAACAALEIKASTAAEIRDGTAGPEPAGRHVTASAANRPWRVFHSARHRATGVKDSPAEEDEVDSGDRDRPNHIDDG